MALSRYGQNLTYTDLSTVYTGDEIKLNHGVIDQVSGALSALSPGVYSGWLAAAGSGLSVSVAAGEGITRHSSYGAVALRSTATQTAAIPASSAGYLHALAENNVSPGGNRSVETMRPKFVFSDLNVLENAVCIAYVVSGAGSISAVYDRRRMVNPEGDVYGGMFAQDDANTEGLTVAFTGGRLTQSAGTVIDVAGFTVIVASGDSYIDIDEDGTAYVRTSSTPVAGHKCIWAATANASEIVTATKDRDRRTGFDFGAGGGGGGPEYTAGEGIDISDDKISIIDDGVTDDKIGERTIDQGLATPGNTGPLASLLSWIAGRIKAITGKTNWYDAPDITLAATKAHVDAAKPHAGHFDVDGSKAMTGNLDMGGFEAVNAVPGTTPNSLATVSQVDALALGYKDLKNAKCMTTGNDALTGLAARDGVALAENDRVFAPLQTTGSESGLWLAHAGAWTRPADYAASSTPDAGTRVFVKYGTVYKGTSWTLLTPGAVVDTDPVAWTQTGAAGTGEANTASNAGSGIGMFKTKAGLDFVFRSLRALSSKLSIAINGDDIEIDVIPAGIDKNTLGGSALTVANGGTGLGSIPKGSILYANAGNSLTLLAPDSDGVERYIAQTDDGAPVRKIPSTPSFGTTSTTSRSIGTGSKTWTVATGLGYKARDWARIEVEGDGSKYMLGQVTGYTGSALTVNVTKAVGSGTYTAWGFNLSGEPAVDGKGYGGTTSSTLITSLGSKSFNTQAGMAYQVGDRVRLRPIGGGHFIEGTVTAYIGTLMTANFDYTSIPPEDGISMSSSWAIGLAGERGAIGPAGADGTTLTQASEAEAKAGAENTHYMTPLRTAQAIAASDTIAFLDSPDFTGSPTAPTRGLYDNSTKLATTAYADMMANQKIDYSIIGHKGDLIVGVEAATVARLPVGSNGQAIVADSTQVGGVKWATVGGGGASAFTDLTDSPTSYTGEGGKFVAVNGAEDGLEFIKAPIGSIVGTTDTQTLSGKRIVPRKFSTASTATLTPEIDSYDYYEVSAQAAALNIANHSTSTPEGGEMILICLTCDPTNRAITFDSNYVARAGVSLPTTLNANKLTTLLFQWHAGLSKYNLLAAGQES